MPSGIKSLVERAGERTATPFRVRFPDGAEYRNARPRRLSRCFSGAIARCGARPCTATSACSRPTSTARSTSKAACPRRSPSAWKAGSTSATWLVRLRNRWHELMHSNANRSPGDENAEFHYALPPEFYKLWLDDPLMLYTCAYWTEGTRTLEEAQRNKCDHVARKLLLKPGEEVVDVGSGFGGFMLHAARALRREGHGDQHHRLAGRARAPARSSAGGSAMRLQMHARFPRRRPRSSTRWRRSAASSTPAATSSAS